MKPTDDILVVLDEAEDKMTNSGIVLIHDKSMREKFARAVVKNVADNISNIYKVGDVVVYPRYRKDKDISDNAPFILRHGDILGKMNDR